MSNCPICGWSESVQASCKTYAQAAACQLNWENTRKFKLRNRDQPAPTFVRSVRQFVADHKGGMTTETLVPLSDDEVRAITHGGGRGWMS